MVAPSIEYPVAFGKEGHLIGVMATRDIGMCESYIYVPVKLTINQEQFRRSWIGEIYEDRFKDYDQVDDEEK